MRMAQTFLVFDFGTDEEKAQQARHRIEGWKQGFRLGNKVQFKFEREAAEQAEGSSKNGEGKSKEKKKDGEAELNGRVRMLVRLDFSNHEKHLAQTWVKRIPADEAFKSVKGEVIRQDEAAFEKIAELFDALK